MNIFLLSVYFFMFTCSDAVRVIIKDVKGYYWREYSGAIPEDAIPGGLDKQGRTTYIGQALHIFPPNGKLIPGIIDATDKKMYYAWGDNSNAYVVTENVKILCSQHPEHFEWIETDIQKAKALSQTDFVKGGYDTSYPLFIGRIHANGEVPVGKVTLTEPYDAVGYVTNAQTHFVKTTFEILSYKIKTNTGNDMGTSEPGCSTENVVNINFY